MCRAALSLVAVAIIAATVVVKLAVQDVAVEEDLGAAMPRLEARLRERGYAVSRAPAGVPSVTAVRDRCAVTVRLIDAHGTYRDTELLKVPPGWTPRYAWRGRWRAARRPRRPPPERLV
mgnify:CR=1 FL=1